VAPSPVEVMSVGVAPRLQSAVSTSQVQYSTPLPPQSDLGQILIGCGWTGVAALYPKASI